MPCLMPCHTTLLTTYYFNTYPTPRKCTIGTKKGAHLYYIFKEMCYHFIINVFLPTSLIFNTATNVPTLATPHQKKTPPKNQKGSLIYKDNEVKYADNQKMMISSAQKKIIQNQMSGEHACRVRHMYVINSSTYFCCKNVVHFYFIYFY